jgi:hypothetical protein
VTVVLSLVALLSSVRERQAADFAESAKTVRRPDAKDIKKKQQEGDCQPRPRSPAFGMT